MFELMKIGIVKRASALLLDAILLMVLTTGFMFIISLICNYSGQEAKARDFYNQWDEFRSDYVPAVAEYYGIAYDENGDEASLALALQEVGKALYESNGEDPETAEAYQKYINLPDVALTNAQSQYVLSLLFMMISLGCLLAYLVLEFIVPIIFKNGQTIGKKIFGIGIVRSNCVKLNTISLFARTFVGKYAIETMFPILLVFLFLFGGIGWVAIILFAAITILNIVLLFATKYKTPIHDILAYTVVVDLALQEIFQSEEELIAKKTLQHKESVLNTVKK